MGERHHSASSIKELIRVSPSGGGATVIGQSMPASSAWAAFANAAFAQVHDANDGYLFAGTRGGFAHPGRIVIPIAFALGEEAAVTGRDLVTAVVIGYEVMCRVGGHDPKPPTGAYGGAAVGARILGLSEQEVLHALGIAGHLDPKRKQYLSGSDANHITSGHTARLGVESALLAKYGASGPPIYDDPTVSTRYRARGLGSQFEVLNVYTKPYPTCRMTHAAVDAALSLRDQIADPLQDIVGVTVYQPTAGMYVTEPCIAPESSHKSCEFSLQYCVAVALLDGEVRESQFVKRRRDDEAVYEMIRRVRVEPDERLDAQYLVVDSGLFAPRPSFVRVALSSGQVLERTVLYPHGHPHNPLSEDDRLEKLREQTTPSLGAIGAETLISGVLGLEMKTPKEVMTGLRVTNWEVPIL